MKLLILRTYGGVVIDTSYVCLQDHSPLNYHADFYVAQDFPRIEDNFPLMSLNIIGATKASKLLEQWHAYFTNYMTDPVFRRKVNSFVGGINDSH